jgi:mRNA-degrading endonuclease RelE of RelBE toxin-antitoxin system
MAVEIACLKYPGVELFTEGGHSDYNVARMRYDIVLAPEAVEDLEILKANARAAVRGALEQHLRHQPTKASKSRIKRLRGFSRPQYRLRVGDDIRVFYDVIDDVVQILAIIPKSEADSWLAKHGDSDETSSSV